MNYIELRLKVADFASRKTGNFEKNFNEIYSKVVGEHPELVTTFSPEDAIAGIAPALVEMINNNGESNGKTKRKVREIVPQIKGE